MTAPAFPKRRPTVRHRPAIVPGILGTVYAIRADGAARYFDYAREAAFAYAGVTADADPRWARLTRDRVASYVTNRATEANPRVGDMVLWVRR